MTEDVAPELVRTAARERGPIPRKGYRVVVLESDGAVTVSDFGDLEGARGYANDAASESDYPSPLAYILDERFQLVARGRHYAAP